MTRLRVGIIGCGEVTQINHLPSLEYLKDSFEVTALSDVSPAVLAGVGECHGVAKRYGDYLELLKDPEVDVVLITTPHAYHAEQALAALENGKHVLVEKPMAMTLEDADKIIEAEARTGLTAQVGYMRRYATAFNEAVARVKHMEGIKLARVHDVIGRNAMMIAPTSRVIRGDDIPAEVREAGVRLEREKVQQAIGDAPDLERAYLLLLGLSTHDISAMRELLGMPKGVLYTAQRSGGLYLSAAFDYGDFVCHFETGVDEIARFDAHLEVYGSAQTLRVVYQSPYVRHLATSLEVTRATPESGLQLERVQPAFEDNFTREWEAFYHNVTTGTRPKTNPQDYRQDLELFTEMVAKLRERVQD